MLAQRLKFVLELVVFACACIQALSFTEVSPFMSKAYYLWLRSSPFRKPFATSQCSVLNFFPQVYYNYNQTTRIEFMLEEEKQEEPNFGSEQPSTVDIRQKQTPGGFFNHMQGQQQMPLNIWFCILATLLKFLPIVLFFTVTRIKILGFTLVLIAASIDFWTLKNISGRELVGMIWWMKVNVDNGDQQWIFHSSEGYSIDKVNEAIFWGTLLLGNVFWGLTTLLSLILSSLFWIALCAFCFLLSALNFYCFMKCQGQHRQKIKDFAEKVGLTSAHRLVDY